MPRYRGTRGITKQITSDERAPAAARFACNKQIGASGDYLEKFAQRIEFEMVQDQICHNAIDRVLFRQPIENIGVYELRAPTDVREGVERFLRNDCFPVDEGDFTWWKVFQHLKGKRPIPTTDFNDVWFGLRLQRFREGTANKFLMAEPAVESLQIATGRDGARIGCR